MPVRKESVAQLHAAEQSSEDVKLLQVSQWVAAEQREETQVKTSCWRAGLISLDPREQPGNWHGFAGQAAGAQCSTTSAATGPFCSMTET